MKKWKLSSKVQDYFWGILLTLSILLWVGLVSLFTW